MVANSYAQIPFQQIRNTQQHKTSNPVKQWLAHLLCALWVAQTDATWLYRSILEDINRISVAAIHGKSIRWLPIITVYTYYPHPHWISRKP